MRELNNTCRWCGKPFATRSHRAKDCPECRDDYKRALARVQYRQKCGLLAEGTGYRAAVEAEVRADVEERRRRAAANRPRCLYCGNVYGVNSSGYCAACRADMDGEEVEDGDAYTAAAITSTFIRVGTVRRLAVARSSIQESTRSRHTSSLNST